MAPSVQCSHFLAMDEQHSRSQRKFGAAPYCTATFMNAQGLIFLMHSVDQSAVDKTAVLTKAGTQAKSKAKVAHCEGMQAVVDYFGPTDTSLRHFCTDQSTDGSSDAETYFRPTWTDFHMNYDIWHKVKEFDQLWKTFCCKRERARGIYSILIIIITICFCFFFCLHWFRPICAQRVAIPLRERPLAFTLLQGPLRILLRRVLCQNC